MLNAVQGYWNGVTAAVFGYWGNASKKPLVIDEFTGTAAQIEVIHGNVQSSDLAAVPSLINDLFSTSHQVH